MSSSGLAAAPAPIAPSSSLNPPGPVLRWRSARTTSSALAAVLAAAGLGAVLLAVVRLARWVLDHRRLAAWDHAWQEAGPRWTTQR